MIHVFEFFEYHKMFCVLRFNDSTESINTEQLGTRLNELVPGLYTGPDRKFPHRFSCTVSSDNSWAAQRQSMFDTLKKSSAIIHEARSKGVNIEFDLAIDSDDYGKAWLTEVSVDLDLLNLLHEHEVELVMSIYGNGDDTGTS